MLSTVPVSDEPTPFTNFDKSLHDWCVASGDCCQLIIDAAQYDEGEVLRRVYALEDNPQWCWLFDETDFEEHQDAGPVVVQTNLNSALCQYAVSHWGADEALAILISGRAQNLALAGIRESLMIRFETYGPCFVRVYDGRFLEVLNVCLPDAVGRLIIEGELLAWIVNCGKDAHWSSAGGISTESEGLSPSQPRSLERLLTWVSGWPRCMAIANNHHHTSNCRLRIIRELWSAGHACPDSDAELGALWQYGEQDFHGLHEQGR